MDMIKTAAHAKINLSLDVLGKRPDGYHELSTVMHEVPLRDELTIKIGEGNGIRAVTNVRYIKSDTNLAAKACRIFYEKLDTIRSSGYKSTGVLIEIDKRIPVGAGLGGGSADAAAVIKALNTFYGDPFNLNEMMEMGAKAGADVPFCIAGGCALCEGIGEIVRPQPPLTRGYLVIVKPRASISTAELFSAYRVAGRHIRPDTAGILRALSLGDIGEVARRVYNVLEPFAEKKCRDISDIRKGLLRLGALGASMTGSGSAVFALFDDMKAAQTAKNAFSERYKDVFLLKF
jgi:4-diphosphocytidyl-2-C-methyl-D-erythritol kinase